MKRFTAILDYGVGNLMSISNALRYLGYQSEITADVSVLERADALILPGVGAFPDAARRLKETGLGKTVVAQAAKKPVLGICLGMQLLFDWGEENGECEGLRLIGGRVARIQTTQKLPHIGWNRLCFPRQSKLFQGLEQEENVYFVHSYHACPTQEETVLATTDHGARIVAAVGQGNVYGCQFHPEKSGEAGLRILRNFEELSQ